MKKTFRKKSKIKKNSKIYKDIKGGVFSPKKIKQRVKSSTKQLKSLLLQKNIPKAELKSKLKKIGATDTVLSDMVNIAIQITEDYEKKLKDKDWEFSVEETKQKAFNAVEVSWGREISGIALEEFVAMYRGYRAVWIPSSSRDPRFEHMPFYGEEFIIGVGVDAEFSKKDLAVDLGSVGLHPAQEWGCNCGIQIISDASVNDSDITFNRKKK
ncbi:unnamed protein product, partial [marine sediment metagenome]